MKILLISASIEAESRAPTIENNSHYPLGLGYIHSYLEKFGHEVSLLFLNDYSYEACHAKIVNALQEFSPDVVGFQLITHNRVSSFRNIEYIHEHYPNIKIVIGGIHTTVFYEQILKKYTYLTAVLGEGEITFKELIDAFESNGELRKINGLAYIDRNTKSLIVTSGRELIKDLDSLPFPKHEHFFNSERTTASMLTSRGCPYACSFCVLDAISRRKVRLRSVENVIAEIEYLVATFDKLESIWIHDDAFLIHNKRVIELCDEIVKRNIVLRFVCSARFKPVSKELVEAMERAGFELVLFGMETGSAKLLISSHKGIKKEDMEKTYRLFAASSIDIVGFLIVGLYGEDESTIMETAQFVQKLQKIKYSYYDDIGVLAIYPGTEIYSIAKEKGLITDDYWLTDKSVPLFTAEHTPEQLFKYKEIIRDHIALKKLKTVDGFKAQWTLLPRILLWRLFFKKINKYRRKANRARRIKKRDAAL